jgi:BMFP domain-containing protein YqiC
MTRELVWDQQRSKVHYWEVMAHWDFAIDVRNREELNVQKMVYAQARDRQKLVTLVTKTIRNRHKKQMAALKGRQSKSVKMEIKRTLEIAELEAQLYYLTGGYFTLKHD